MPKSAKKKTDLSVIILNYNSGNYLQHCLDSINQSEINNYFIEIIVVDNASTDHSFSKLKLPNSAKIIYKKLALDKNLGFSAGNNRGLKITSPDSRYLLFLNPDTTVQKDTFAKMINFFAKNPQVDAATCHINLVATGQLQPESHRGFPNPWNTFWHFFGFGLPKLFPKSKLLNGYFLGHLDYSKVQKIDACVGAFLMVKRSVGQDIGWWNEKYFMYGEDLDFCYQLRQKGYSLYFFPNTKIDHFQGISSGIKEKTQKITQASLQTKIRSAKATTQAMRIFYQQNLINNYPKILHWFIWQGINLLEFYRLSKIKLKNK